MTSVRLKRLAKERERFPADDSEFWANFKDDDLRTFEAYIVGPVESVYQHKLIKLRFDIPDEYPIVPPTVTFIQHAGDRLHPNLYTEGKVCLSILGTWSGPGWSQNMTIESVLRTLRSLLDDKPYLHEPHQTNRPGFNAYVRYHSWRWLLLEYLDREQDIDGKVWLDRYMLKHGNDMIAELERQKEQSRTAALSEPMASPYCTRQRHLVDYDRLLSDLRARIPETVEQSDMPSARIPATGDAFFKRKPSIDVETSEQAMPSPVRKKQHVATDLEGPTYHSPTDSAPKLPPKRNAEVIDLTAD